LASIALDERDPENRLALLRLQEVLVAACAAQTADGALVTVTLGAAARSVE
jgi:hypothetical protein